MSVSDLTNTSWLFNATLVSPSSSIYGKINFTSDGNPSRNYIELDIRTGIYVDYYYGSWSRDTAYSRSSGWASTEYRTIHITDGNDVTNATLIAWIEANATQIQTVTYTVTFNANGHGTAPSPITGVTSGSTISAPTAPTETGWTFGGWYKEQACTNAWNFSTDTVTQDTTLWAKWTINEYTISYKPGSYSAESTEYTDTKVYGAGIDLYGAKYTRSGYAQTGWSTSASGATKAYDLEQLYTAEASITLYPYWTQVVTHTVSFNMQGHGTQVSSQTITDGQTATEPSPAPTASGYTFWGWFEESACTNQFDFSTPITADKTLYAKWTVYVQTYTLTFDMNGHGTQVPPQTIEAGQSATRPTNPTAAGWTFNNWYADSALTTIFDFSQAINENKTVYAKWTANPQYTVSFNMMGHGDPIPSQTVNSGATAVTPNPPTAEGYEFQGWYDSTLTLAFNFATPITQNTTLYAKWYQPPTLNWNGNRHNEDYIFKRVEWPNFQEHESYDYITKGSVEYSTEADLKVTGSFDFEGYDVPDPNDLVRVYYSFTDDNGLAAYEPIATLFVNYASLNYEDTLKGIKASGSLEGSSVLKVLQDKIAALPYTVKMNTNAVYEADDIIRDAGLQTNLEASGFVLSVDKTFDSGTTYLEIVNWLLTTAGYAEAYPDGNGVVQLISTATIQNRAVKQTFVNNEQSIMYPEVEEANDWYETPNVVRLLYNTDDACVIAEATNTTGSRASLDARGSREKTYFEEVSDVGEGAIVNLLQELAEKTLKEQSCDVEYVTLSHAFVPIEILDLIEIEYSDMRWSGLADNISIELEPSTKTQTKIKRTLYEDIVITSSATVYRS